MKEYPTQEDLKLTTDLSNPNEEFFIKEDCIYSNYVVGVGKAKMGVNFFEKKLKVKVTARNYRTILKLIDLAF